MYKLILCFVFILASCTETKVSKKSKSAVPDNSSPPKSADYYSGDVVLKQGVSFTLSADTFFTQAVDSGYTFSIENAPDTVSINSTNGAISGYYTTPGLFEGVYVKATSISNSSEIVESDSFSVAVNGDPLRLQAWHLNNTGQRTFSSTRGTADFDINIDPVLRAGITGNGVKIAISDSGVENNHDDLNDNELSSLHRNYSIGSPYIGDPTPVDFHGTSVTGLISAVAYNNFGSLGVAPQSKYAGFLFLADGVDQTSEQIIHQAQGDFDIFNYSYGDFITNDERSLNAYLDQLEYQTLENNKVFVKAAGNEYFVTGGSGMCVSHNANFPYENESPHMIIVGAINADGHKSSYSNAGSNLWVSAPGGEDGDLFGPGIITTDLRTCFKGLSKAGADSDNSFEYNHPQNLQCDYTATMNGTSSAAPIVSGVIALMREVNPSLKMRDIKHIFAQTSKQVDADFTDNIFSTDHPSSYSAASSICTIDLELTGHTYEQGWVENKATTGPGSDNNGFVYSNFYGFGLIDAEAAVNMAQTYTSYLPDQESEVISSGSLGLTIPNDSSDESVNATGVTHSMSISNDRFVESVQVDLKVAHLRSGEVGVELTSPSGTKSILMNINNSFLLDNDSNLNIMLTSNAFYGESSQGNWTIKLIDGRTNSYSGSLTSWTFEVLGH